MGFDGSKKGGSDLMDEMDFSSDLIGNHGKLLSPVKRGWRELLQSHFGLK